MFCVKIIRNANNLVRVINKNSNTLKGKDITVATNGIQGLSKCLSSMSVTGTIGPAEPAKTVPQPTQPAPSVSKPVANDSLNACSEENIVWVDLEMTGLDPDKDHVLEVACLVTDGQLNVLAEGPDLCIQQPQDVLDNMNAWSIKQHGESGLTHNCQTSTVSLQDAERQLLDFVRHWTPYKKCPLGGNTIYMDRFFLMKHMPEFEQHMHYRIIDVSSVKELCRRWYPSDLCHMPRQYGQKCTHRAMDDIRTSVEILKHYKSKLFRHLYSLDAGMEYSTPNRVLLDNM